MPLRAIVLAGLLALVACHSTRPAQPTTRPPDDRGAVQSGLATWYATGTMTASGERFNRRAMTAAHRTLPFGSVVKVTHRRSGKSVKVRINDRGPFGSKKRIIDISEAAAERLGIVGEGVAPVTVEVLERGSGRRSHRRGRK